MALSPLLTPQHCWNIFHFFLVSLLVLILLCIIFMAGMGSTFITLMMHSLNEQLKVRWSRNWRGSSVEAQPASPSLFHAPHPHPEG